MDSIKVLIDGVEKEVFGVFYIYESKYYFIYTEKEIDENGYVVLYMTQVGKETQATPTGTVETGFMVGMEITDPEDQKKVQTSISYIVEDKKNGTINPQIQYLPMSMLTKLKIISKKRFRLLKSLMTDNFGLTFENSEVQNDANSGELNLNPVAEPTPQGLEPLNPVNSVDNEQNSSEPVLNTANLNSNVTEPVVVADIFNNPASDQTIEKVLETSVEQATNNLDNNVIIDYRAKYFEEEEKNKELLAQIEELTQKINDIKSILE